MPERVRDLAGENIITHGYVENVEPFFASCLLTVAPLRWGAGVKGKINQSMSYGVPVVSTSTGAEGMHLRHEKDILVADRPRDFAMQIIRLHRDEELWNKLSRGGKANIRKHFSFAVAKGALENLLSEFDLLPLGARGATRLKADRGPASAQRSEAARHLQKPASG
ncbi:MAG: glycosyltransferase family 4 protein [Chthoniobacterales bacterium]